MSKIKCIHEGCERVFKTEEALHASAIFVCRDHTLPGAAKGSEPQPIMVNDLTESFLIEDENGEFPERFDIRKSRIPKGT